MSLLRSNQLNTAFKDFDALIKYKGYVTGQGQMYHQAVLEFLNYMDSREISIFQIDRDLMISYYNRLLTRPNKRGGKLAQNHSEASSFRYKVIF